MANKIPVGQTISRTYGFAFGNFVNNLGAIWIPAVIMMVGVYLITPGYMATMSHMATVVPPASDGAVSPAAAQAAAMQNLTALSAAAPYLMLLFVLVFACYAAMAAALTKEALGKRTGSPFLSNPFGAAFWNLIVAYLLLIAVFVGLYIATVIVVIIAGVIIGVIGAAGGTGGTIAAAVLGVIGVIALIGAFLYVATRFSFLLVPVVVAENRVTVFRGWHLTHGNFWRIFAVILAILIPLFIVEMILFSILFAGTFSGLHANMTPQEIQAWSQGLSQALLQRQQDYWYIYYPVTILFSVIFYGLFSGASAFSYRALAPDSSVPDVF